MWALLSFQSSVLWFLSANEAIADRLTTVETFSFFTTNVCDEKNWGITYTSAMVVLLRSDMSLFHDSRRRSNWWNKRSSRYESWRHCHCTLIGWCNDYAITVLRIEIYAKSRPASCMLAAHSPLLRPHSPLQTGTQLNRRLSLRTLWLYHSLARLDTGMLHPGNQLRVKSPPVIKTKSEKPLRSKSRDKAKVSKYRYINRIIKCDVILLSL